MFCTIKTVDGCYFDTRAQQVFMTPNHMDKFDFITGDEFPWRGNTLHYCEDGMFELTIENSKLVRFDGCPEYPQFVPVTLGYKYTLFMESLDGLVFEPVMTLDGEDGPLTFPDLTLPDYLDTAMYYVVAYSWQLRCAFPMDDTVYVVKDFKPVADIGEDSPIEICGTECHTFNAHTGVPYSYRDETFAYSWEWTYISGGSDGNLTFDQTDSTTNVCVEFCNYGEYELTWIVKNGDCIIRML